VLEFVELGTAGNGCLARASLAVCFAYHE
jgi:hypothetical protein